MARKDCVGTTVQKQSKVWYTIADGVLSDVYSPTVDNTNVETMQYVVTDGHSFTDLQTRDLTPTVSADATGMVCTVVATSAAHGYQLVTTYITDPARDAVVTHTTVRSIQGPPPRRLRLYIRLDAHVNGNGGGGKPNAGADSAVIDNSTHTPIPVAYDTATATNAGNRDYATPTFMALSAAGGFTKASAGYAGTASDGLTQLNTSHALGDNTAAPNGHVVLTARVVPDPHGEITLALGFGRDQRGAMTTAAAAAASPFAATLASYTAGWRAYDAHLRPPPATLLGLDQAAMDRTRSAYYLSANVIKASEDKTFPGTIVASLASPWGQAISAGDLKNGKPVYFGSYREVFSRDLYEAFTALLVDGDLATAQDATRFLFMHQQLPNGSMPRNSLLNGKKAPDTGSTPQLDETAYPLLMAWQSGLGDDTELWNDHIRRAADFLVAHGPAVGVERWEEQTGYSPSTIAAEIAGLTAASAIADQHHDTTRAKIYQATADDFQRHVKDWTLTTTGPYGPRYFLRLSQTGDPNTARVYPLGNGAPKADQRRIVDAGFLELVRLSELPATDPDVLASLTVVDATIRRDTPSGLGFYRYGTSAPGSWDGYGDCYQPGPSNCAPPGRPWPTGDDKGSGTGHLWPLLSGERAEQQLQTGDTPTAAALLVSMEQMASGVGLEPEQDWEDPPLPAAPYGKDPTQASIGFEPGHPAGSASPLTWAQAQLVRLVLALDAGRPLEQPAITRARYVDAPPPHTAPLNATVSTTATLLTVTGRTTPGASVDVAVTDPNAVDAPTTTASAHVNPDGTFSLPIQRHPATGVVTVTTTTENATGYLVLGIAR